VHFLANKYKKKLADWRVPWNEDRSVVVLMRLRDYL